MARSIIVKVDICGKIHCIRSMFLELVLGALPCPLFLLSSLLCRNLARYVSQGSVLQDVSGGVAHIHKNAVQLAVRLVAINQLLQAGTVGKRRQWPVNGANDFTEKYLVGRPL